MYCCDMMEVASMDMQISLFDTAPELFSAEDAELADVLKFTAHGWESSKLRIYAAYMLLEPDRFAEFLADEFGVSGHSIPGGFVDFRGSGIEIRHWEDGTKQRWSWRKAAEVYRSLIAGGWPGEKIVRQYAEARKAGKGAPMPGRKYWEEGFG